MYVLVLKVQLNINQPWPKLFFVTALMAL